MPQNIYDAASALKEALTEKLFDGLAGVYGKGAADDFVDDLARNLTKSEGGQALLRGLLNTGGEGAEEVISGFVDPALQSIYNGKALGENYRELNMADLLHGGAVGMLLGGLGGVVDIAQTGQDATGRAGLSTLYSDLINATAATENQTANHPDQSRYQELLQKFLDGSIAPQEGAELWRLEIIWGQSDTSNQYNTHLAKNPEDRYTQIDPDEENIRQNFGLAERGREFDTNGNPIFATTREEAAIDGIDYVALKAARKEADAEYGLTDGEAKSLAGYQRVEKVFSPRCASF